MSARACCKCGIEKPLTDFVKSTTRKDGTHSYCKVCFSARGRAYYAANRAQEIARSDKWNKANKDRYKSNVRRSVNKNRTLINARNREKRKLNPEPFRLREHNKNARRRSVGGTGLSMKDWRSILEKYRHCCYHCGTSNLRLTKDHLIPLAKGGLHEAGNIVPACYLCNARKRDLLPHEWAAYRGLLL